MVLKIEEGKFYRSLGGERFGPMTPDDSFSEKAFISVAGDGNGWNEHGRYIGCSSINSGRKFDLISEWTDEPSPVRTVTRKEIVPGYYGFVKVANAAMEGHAHISIHACEMDATKLRAAAATFTEIADALEQAP